MASLTLGRTDRTGNPRDIWREKGPQWHPRPGDTHTAFQYSGALARDALFMRKKKKNKELRD